MYSTCCQYIFVVNIFSVIKINEKHCVPKYENIQNIVATINNFKHQDQSYQNNQIFMTTASQPAAIPYYPGLVQKKEKYTIIKKDESHSGNLLHLLTQKSERGFSLLYDNYSDALFNVIYKMVKDVPAAEDVLQDVFVKIWTKIHHYDTNKGTLYTWMINIAKNSSIDFVRSNKKHVQKKTSFESMPEMAHLQPDSVNKVERLDYIAIRNRSCSLHEKYSVVIDLVYHEGLTQEETAQVLQLPLGTVKTRARKALSILKNIYNEQ